MTDRWCMMRCRMRACALTSVDRKWHDAFAGTANRAVIPAARQRFYSARKVTIGSIRVARRAGR